MKKASSIGCLTVLLIALLTVAGNLAYVVRATTEVSGIIATDTTWTEANSPYDLTGNILISNGAKLSIEPGVTLNLNDYYIMVNGTLFARGNYTNPIYVNSGEITFTEFSADWNKSSSSGCIVESAIVSSDMAISTSAKISNVTCLGFIDIQNPGKPIIANNTLKGGVRIHGGGIIANNIILDEGVTVWENATVTNNLVVGCSTGIEAITYYWDDNNPTAWPNSTSLIEGNLIFGNTNGIVVRPHQGASPGRPIIRNNTIANNTVGIYVTVQALGEPNPTILNNNIYNNSDYNLKSNVPTAINATFNWWGTTDTDAINQTIYDFKNDFSLGTVTFTPFLNETNPFAPEIPLDIIPDLPSKLLTLLMIISLSATTVILRKKLLKNQEKLK